MTDKELIKLLKDNRYPFGMWTDQECYGPRLGKEMQEKAKKIGKINFIYYASADHWDQAHVSNNEFHPTNTYRLRPDYQEPEPEIVKEARIYNDGNELYFEDIGEPVPMTSAINSKNFLGFKCDGWIFGCLYKNKKDPSMVHYMIKESDLLLYDVVSLDGGKVLFRRQT